jgi:uncharacterized membrane protein YeaQ/YmgE (transglycosylase-associated protein family)
MNILAWILLGLIAGGFAKTIYPGSQGGSILSTMILGTIGSFVGGSLAMFFETGTFKIASASLNIPGVFIAVLGAILAIFLWGLLNKRAV